MIIEINSQVIEDIISCLRPVFREFSSSFEEAEWIVRDIVKRGAMTANRTAARIRSAKLCILRFFFISASPPL